MIRQKWTEKNNNFLIENYNNMDNDKLIHELSRSWNAIKLQSAKLGLKRYKNINRFANLDILLNDDNITYYWIGFIMADGNIINNRLRIRISDKDENHLLRFKKYVKFDKKLNYGKTIINNKQYNWVGISMMDTKYIKKLSDKFDIRNNKTYIPCNIKNINDDNLLLSLITGFIDGDGSIRNQFNRKDFNLRIKCHKNWYNNLDFILKTIIRITDEDCKTSVKLVDNGKYAIMSITNTKTLKILKNKIIKLNIPYLYRKWDIIDLNYETFYERSKKNKKIFKELFENNENIKVKEIAKIMNCSINTIYKYKKLLTNISSFVLYFFLL